MIYDLNANVITSVAITDPPGQNYEFSALVDCKNGYSIRGTAADPKVTLKGKANPGDAYQNIETTPIDTSAYSPARRQFYFRIDVDADADQVSELLAITVAP